MQYLEEIYVKHCLESSEITYYKIYVDGVLKNFGQNKTNEDTFHNITKNTDEHLQFKISREGNKPIKYLDFPNRNYKKVDLISYRKHTHIKARYISTPITRTVIN